MFVKIPFESEIKFKTNISEITKMSLEHDFNINDDRVLGNFYVSGEYKVHEISINKEPFNYTLPFTVELREEIDLNSLEFNIEDFSYEVKDNDTLKVFIEYSLKGEEIEKEDSTNEVVDTTFERVNEDELTSEMEFIDDFLEKNEEEKEEVVQDKEEVNEILEEEEKEVIEEKEVKEEARNITEAEEKTIMETIKSSDDTFVTYHIHIVKESETLESISLLYNAPKSLLEEYNGDANLNIGDKILIPKLDE